MLDTHIESIIRKLVTHTCVCVCVVLTDSWKLNIVFLLFKMSQLAYAKLV